MSLITPDFGLLFWMLVIFGAVFFILAKFGFPLITSMVDKRNEHIRESLRAAEQARLSLENLAAEQARLIEQTKVEQGRIIKEAADAKAAMLAQAREQAGIEAAKVLEKYGTKPLQYGATQGVPELREVIAKRYGVPLSQVQITTSSQQGNYQ